MSSDDVCAISMGLSRDENIKSAGHFANTWLPMYTCTFSNDNAVIMRHIVLYAALTFVKLPI